MNELTQVAVPLNSTVFYAFVVYLLIIIGIGIASARFSSEGIGEFYLAGRKLKRFVVALSAVVSGRSAWLMVGVSGMAFTMGVSAVWAVVGYIVAELFLFLFVGKRLRRFSEQHDVITLPEYFAIRFGKEEQGKFSPSRSLRVVSVVVITIFMVAYVAAQFNAGGKAFSATFDITMAQGVWFTALIVLAYTILGGYLAVSLTDMVQAIVMIIALVVLPIVAVIDFGGQSLVLQELANQKGSLIDPVAIGVGGVIGFLGIGLGSPGQPHILVRYMSVDDPRQLRYSALVGTIWNVVMAWGAIYIGLLGRAFYKSKDVLPNQDPENIFPSLAGEHLPPVLFGIIIAAILAAIMSTADSQLLVAASGLVRDIYEKIIKKGEELSQRHLVIMSRVIVLILVAVALYFALTSSEWVFWLVLFAWAGLGAAFGPPLLLSLFWKDMTIAGALAGMISGFLIIFIWTSISTLDNFLYELVPAFIGSGVLTIVFSKFGAPPEKAQEILENISAKYRRTKKE